MCGWVHTNADRLACEMKTTFCFSCYSEQPTHDQWWLIYCTSRDQLWLSIALPVISYGYLLHFLWSINSRDQLVDLLHFPWSTKADLLHFRDLLLSDTGANCCYNVLLQCTYIIIIIVTGMSTQSLDHLAAGGCNSIKPLTNWHPIERSDTLIGDWSNFGPSLPTNSYP